MSKEAMKLALEALETCTPQDTSTGHVIYAWHDEELVNKAIKALEEALAKQEQGEPVAEIVDHGGYAHVDWKAGLKHPVGTKFYTTPQQRKPLTHEQRFDLLTQFEPHKNKWEAPAIFIDMVEAAHGIKE